MNFYIGNNPQADGLSAVLPGAAGHWSGGPEEPQRIAEAALDRTLSAGEASAFWYSRALAWITSDPAAWAKLMLRKLRLFWSPFELLNNQPIWFFAELSEVSVLFWVGFPVVASLAGGGAVLCYRRSVKWFVPLAFFLIYMATVVAFFCPARYRLPVAPVLILFAAAGLSRAVELVRSRDYAALRLYLAVCGGCGLLMGAGALGGGVVAANDAAEGNHLLGLHYATSTPGRPADYDKASEYLRKAIELGQQSPGPRLALGEVLLQQGKAAQAGQQFAQAAVKYPDSVEARLRYGRSLSSQGRPAAAIEQYRAALVLQPGLLPAKLQLADALASLGRYEEAIGLYEDVRRRAQAAGLEEVAGDVEDRLRHCRQKQQRQD